MLDSDSVLLPVDPASYFRLVSICEETLNHIEPLNRHIHSNDHAVCKQGQIAHRLLTVVALVLSRIILN